MSRITAAQNGSRDTDGLFFMMVITTHLKTLCKKPLELNESRTSTRLMQSGYWSNWDSKSYQDQDLPELSMAQASLALFCFHIPGGMQVSSINPGEQGHGRSSCGHLYSLGL